MKSVVVTGVSTGTGYGATRVLIDRGLHVFGSVRKQADADRLAADFGGSFTPLLFDVTDEAAITVRGCKQQYCGKVDAGTGAEAGDRQGYRQSCGVVAKVMTTARVLWR